VTDTTDLFAGSPEPSSTDEPIAAGVAADPDRTSDSAGSSLGPDGAVRSWVGGRDADSRRTSVAEHLATMLLPELQRLAQSLGITGAGRMRKSQVIAAIEERQQNRNSVGGGRHDVGLEPAGAGLGEPSQHGASDHRQTPHIQNEVNGNSVKRSAPAGAGAPRQLEQEKNK